MGMNKQEIFDKTVEHAVKQRMRCRRAYRGVCNTKQGKVLVGCFVGFHIKDQHYTHELEGHDVWHPRVLNALGQSLGEKLAADDLGLFVQLQHTYDRYAVQEWPREFKIIARIHGLKYNGPDTLEGLGEE